MRYKLLTLTLVIFLLIFSFFQVKAKEVTSSSMTVDEIKTLFNAKTMKYNFMSKKGQYFSVWVEIYLGGNKSTPKKIIPVLKNIRLKQNEFSFLIAIRKSDFFLDTGILNLYSGIEYQINSQTSNKVFKEIKTKFISEKLNFEIVPKNLTLISAFRKNNFKSIANKSTPVYIDRLVSTSKNESINFNNIKNQVKESRMIITMKIIVSDFFVKELNNQL